MFCYYWQKYYRKALLYIKSIKILFQGHKGQFSPQSHIYEARVELPAKQTTNSMNSVAELLYDKIDEIELSWIKWKSIKGILRFQKLVLL
jgi:hypothetical protein